MGHQVINHILDISNHPPFIEDVTDDEEIAARDALSKAQDGYVPRVYSIKHAEIIQNKECVYTVTSFHNANLHLCDFHRWENLFVKKQNTVSAETPLKVAVMKDVAYLLFEKKGPELKRIGRLFVGRFSSRKPETVVRKMRIKHFEYLYKKATP
jgi:hypothetical protein